VAVTIGNKGLGAEGGTRTPTSCLTRPSNVRVCQFRHFGIEVSLEGCGHYSRKSFQSNSTHYLLAAGDAAGAAGEACCVGAGTGVGVAAGALSDCKTDRVPVSVGKPSASAININAAAAPIVIFASRLAVPRGPNAVLDRVLEKSAPASALPG
jgi:hypothetical protein